MYMHDVMCRNVCMCELFESVCSLMFMFVYVDARMRKCECACFNHIVSYMLLNDNTKRAVMYVRRAVKRCRHVSVYQRYLGSNKSFQEYELFKKIRVAVCDVQYTLSQLFFCFAAIRLLLLFFLCHQCTSNPTRSSGARATVDEDPAQVCGVVRHERTIRTDDTMQLVPADLVVCPMPS